MKNFLIVCFVVLVSRSNAQTQETVVNNDTSHYIVAFTEHFDDSRLQEIKQQLEIECGDQLVYLMGHLASIHCTKSVISNISTEAQVKYIELNTQVEAATCYVYERDSRDSWGLDRIDQRGEINHFSSSRRKYTFTESDDGSNVQVYILDSGIEKHNELELEFGNRVVWLHAFDGNHDDEYGHGTQIAALIGSQSYGVAKLANLVSIKVLDGTGVGDVTDVIAGINSVLTHYQSLPMPKKAVVNLSIYVSSISDALEDAVQALYSAGIPVVVAAGNQGTDACGAYLAHLPAPWVITVGATNKFDRVSEWSNVGDCVDIFAPGEAVTTMNQYGQKVHVHGTSYAGAHVTGVIARYLSEYIDFSTSPAWVWSHVRDEATIGAIEFRVNTTEELSPNRLVYVEACTNTRAVGTNLSVSVLLMAALLLMLK